MSLFKGNYLRVLTPVTVDGINLAYRDNKPIFKETHLPVTALRHLERKNKRLPNQLKMQIQEIDNTVVQRPLPEDPDIVKLSTAQLSQLMARVKQADEIIAKEDSKLRVPKVPGTAKPTVQEVAKETV